MRKQTHYDWNNSGDDIKVEKVLYPSGCLRNVWDCPKSNTKALISIKAETEFTLAGAFTMIGIIQQTPSRWKRTRKSEAELTMKKISYQCIMRQRWKSIWSPLVMLRLFKHLLSSIRIFVAYNHFDISSSMHFTWCDCVCTLLSLTERWQQNDHFHILIDSAAHSSKRKKLTFLLTEVIANMKITS